MILYLEAFPLQPLVISHNTQLENKYITNMQMMMNIQYAECQTDRRCFAEDNQLYLLGSAGVFIPDHH